MQTPATDNATAVVYLEAMYPFNGANSRQLSFKKHEKLKLLREEEGGGWYIAENEKNKIGLVPANYLRRIGGNNV